MDNVKNTETTAKRERQPAARRLRSVIETDYAKEVDSYQSGGRLKPLLLLGDARVVLDQLPPSCIDFAMTSPPYWGKREYEGGGIGQEDDHHEFIRHLSDIFLALKRVLKPEGSFWLNIGDTY